MSDKTPLGWPIITQKLLDEAISSLTPVESSRDLEAKLAIAIEALEYYSEAKVTVQDPMNEGIEMHISDPDVAKEALQKIRGEKT